MGSAGAREELVVELEAWEAAVGTIKRVAVPPGLRTVAVRIPTGVKDNTLLRLPGQGVKPLDGSPPGDLLVRVRVTPTVRATPTAYLQPAEDAGQATAARPAGTNRFTLPAIATAVVLVLLAGVVSVVYFRSRDNRSAVAEPSLTASATPTPSPTRVSEDEYRQLLTALDEALTPEFQRLSTARTPAAVSDAASSSRTSLLSHTDTLRELVPPVIAQAQHDNLIPALDALAADLATASGAGDRKAVCVGSSAIAMVSRSAGAERVRSAAGALSAVDQTHPFRVGSFLPGSTADATRRPANGTLITKPSRRGLGTLTVDNGGSSDAAVSLVPLNSKAAILSMYVRAGGSFTASGVTDGQYDIFVTSGTDWDPAGRLFTRDCDFAKFDKPTMFVTSNSQYTRVSITLTPVMNGNTTIKPVNPDGFPSP